MELNKRGKIIKHNTEVLIGLNAHHWEVQPGKYSYEGPQDDEVERDTYRVSYNPLAFGYSALWDSEIMFNGRISTSVKIGLVKHLANIFHSMMQWQSAQRGRKIGIEADLTQGGIVHSQDSKLHIKIHWENRYDNDTHILLDSRLESFLIDFKGCTEGRMPREHIVYIDTEGTAFLGYCSSVVPTLIPNDMTGIFRKVYR